MVIFNSYVKLPEGTSSNICLYDIYKRTSAHLSLRHSYHIVSYRIVSYHILSHRITSHHTHTSHTHTPTHIITYIYMYVYIYIYIRNKDIPTLPDQENSPYRQVEVTRAKWGPRRAWRRVHGGSPVIKRGWLDNKTYKMTENHGKICEQSLINGGF